MILYGTAIILSTSPKYVIDIMIHKFVKNQVKYLLKFFNYLGVFFSLLSTSIREMPKGNLLGVIICWKYKILAKIDRKLIPSQCNREYDLLH